MNAPQIPTVTDLYQKYVKALRSSGLTAQSGLGKWTQAVKKHWASIGDGLGFTVWGHTNTEYMVDLAWERESDSQRFFELALESEWSPSFDEILWDFRKLIYVKAPIKVFLFTVSEDSREERIECLAHEIVKCPFTVEGEQYLLVPHTDVYPSSGGFLVRIQGFVIDHGGSSRSLGDLVELTFR